MSWSTTKTYFQKRLKEVGCTVNKEVFTEMAIGENIVHMQAELLMGDAGLLDSKNGCYSFNLPVSVKIGYQMKKDMASTYDAALLFMTKFLTAALKFTDDDNESELKHVECSGSDISRYTEKETTILKIDMKFNCTIYIKA